MFESEEFSSWFKENTPKEGLSENTTFTRQFLIDAWDNGYANGCYKANEWHKVSEKLPEMDELVYIWNNVDDFPIVACRHIPYGKKEWVWDCKWGSGYTVSQSVAENYLWKEIVPPKEDE